MSVSGVMLGTPGTRTAGGIERRDLHSAETCRAVGKLHYMPCFAHQNLAERVARKALVVSCFGHMDLAEQSITLLCIDMHAAMIPFLNTRILQNGFGVESLKSLLGPRILVRSLLSSTECK
eukprot:1161563-Pelagomonas_calceolata.AAC.5